MYKKKILTQNTSYEVFFINKILFSLFSVPLMFSSIFTIAYLCTYGEMNLISNGEIVKISDSEKAEIQE